MGIKLYVRASSSPCHTVYMIVEALKLEDVEFIEINLSKGEHRTEEFLKMNPQHTLPTLKDSDFVLWDSHAIITYLVSQYAKDDTLYPKDTKKRAIIDQRLHFDNAVLINSLREAMIPVLYLNEKTFRPESLTRIKEGYDFTEKFFNGQYLAGDTITVADICASSTISCLEVILPIDKETYPNLISWLGRVSKEEFYIKRKVPGIEAFRKLLVARGVQFQ